MEDNIISTPQKNLLSIIAIVVGAVGVLIAIIALIVGGGKNGTDGKDGKDGITPTISISEDGYWVINGEKTDVKAEGKDGADGNSTSYNPQGLDFYLKDDGTYAIAIGKAKYLSKIEIPATYNGKVVTEIAPGGFSGALSNDAFQLKEIVIPDSVTTIGSNAFYNCDSLSSVVIGNSVTTIGYSAFYECSNLSSVVIGDSVTTIGDYAFDFCNSLTDVYYTGSKAEWQGITIGSGNSSLTNKTIHYNYVPEN